jgi:hyperosmotically inducible periplasmic protein
MRSFKPLMCAAMLGGALLIPSAEILAAGTAGQETANADKTKDTVNADQAKNGQTDRTLMRSIRRAVVKDKALSTSAHNVKIVAMNGKVTLRGVVDSENEKQAVEAHATKLAGAGNVTNELTVKGS